MQHRQIILALVFLVVAGSCTSSEFISLVQKGRKVMGNEFDALLELGEQHRIMQTNWDVEFCNTLDQLIETTKLEQVNIQKSATAQITLWNESIKTAQNSSTYYSGLIASVQANLTKLNSSFPNTSYIKEQLTLYQTRWNKIKDLPDNEKICTLEMRKSIAKTTFPQFAKGLRQALDWLKKTRSGKGTTTIDVKFHNEEVCPINNDIIQPLSAALINSMIPCFVMPWLVQLRSIYSQVNTFRFAFYNMADLTYEKPPQVFSSWISNNLVIAADLQTQALDSQTSALQAQLDSPFAQPNPAWEFGDPAMVSANVSYWNQELTLAQQSASTVASDITYQTTVLTSYQGFYDDAQTQIKNLNGMISTLQLETQKQILSRNETINVVESLKTYIKTNYKQVDSAINTQ